MARDILVVDDEADIRMLVGGILKDEGFKVREASDSDSVLNAIKTRMPSLILLDIWLEGSRMDGLEILKEIKRNHLPVPVIIMSGHGNVETAVTATKNGAYDFIEKPFNSERLLLVVSNAIEDARLRKENQELKIKAGHDVELIGNSTVISGVRQLINKVAPTGSRVLITGPAGVGKEIAARAIHKNSRRSDAPFVVVNCAAMHPERMEKELFGVEAGVENPDAPLKIGTFEQAHGGTLLLDNVADMPLQTQGKIVRVLQDQTFERVGGATRVEVDVRVIATSNRDLKKEIEKGNFREDLYYRLNVVPIVIPALKERRDDIPQLSEYFLKQAEQPLELLASDAVTALQAYDWPGNVRQLRNVIDWLLIMTPVDVLNPITSDMLPPDVNKEATVSTAQNSSDIISLPLREAREMFEREYLAAQYARFGKNVTKTATFIEMERSALHRKLKSLGVTGNDYLSD